MDLLLQLGIFVFGTVIGSFLNVVILRYGQKSLNGRSACPSCGQQLRWFELIPVLSFIFLRGKCRKCQRKISWQYPLVEIVTGTLFLLIFNFSALGEQFFTLAGDPLLGGQFLNLILLWIIFSLLIIIFVYDLYHKIIPDFWVFLFSGLALVNFLVLDFSAQGGSALGGQFFSFSLANNLWAGPILALPFAFLWFISGGKWMGLGDSKLSLGIGWFLGFAGGSSAIILGVWIGAVVGLFLVALSKVMRKKQLSFMGKNFTIKSELPFAPFLIIGVVLVFFFGWDVWGLSLFL